MINTQIAMTSCAFPLAVYICLPVPEQVSTRQDQGYSRDDRPPGETPRGHIVMYCHHPFFPAWTLRNSNPHSPPCRGGALPVKLRARRAPRGGSDPSVSLLSGGRHPLRPPGDAHPAHLPSGRLLDTSLTSMRLRAVRKTRPSISPAGGVSCLGRSRHVRKLTSLL